jgi:serine phosphatase RsbU (regulator of sigma subunit)/methyl-accepting chemotaxis protein
MKQQYQFKKLTQVPKSIKGRLRYAAYTYTIVVVAMTLAFFGFVLQDEKLERLTKIINDINLQLSKANNLEKDFFIFEAINPDFYQTGKSDYVTEHKQAVAKIKKSLQALATFTETQTNDLKQQLQSIENKIELSENVFDSLLFVIRQKGFRDYGLEGQMRKHIHEVEDFSQINPIYVLKARRAEKDFIIRKDEAYVQQLREAVDILRQNGKTAIANPAEQGRFLTELDAYEQTFLAIVKLEKIVGLQSEQGLKKRFAQISAEVESQINAMEETIYARSWQYRFLLKTIIIFLLLFFLGIIIFISYQIVSTLGRPIEDLSESIQLIIENNFDPDIQLVQIETQDEIGRLSSDFGLMFKKLQERNAEVTQKKIELEEQRDQLEQSFENIKLLNRIGQSITSNLTIENIIETVYISIHALIEDANSLAIGIYNETHNQLDFFTEKGDGTGKIVTSHQSLNDDKSLSVYCFVNQEVVIIQDIQQEYENYFATDISLKDYGNRRAFVYIPLTSSQQRIGLLTVQSTEINAFTEYHVDILRNIAIFTTIALENSNAYIQINEQNKKIIDSINYARRIQSAMLPTLERIQKYLPEIFILLKPRDIVSGDFYWFAHTEVQPIYEEVSTNKGVSRVLTGFENEKYYLAAVDATGHGVPGAFMSMIGSELLNTIVLQKGIHNPDEILSKLHEGINVALKQEETQNRDGMDIALVVIDLEDQHLEFSGAYNPLYLVQDEQLNIVKADKNPIGGWHFAGQDRKFTRHEIDLSKPTTFYMFSDGYADQIGGENNSKFMARRFKDLIWDIHQKPMAEQQSILDETIKNWLGSNRPIDDILVIGVRIQP